LDADGIAVSTSITANSSTLKDAAGNDLTLTLNSVGATSGVLVDADAPTVSSVSVPSNGSYYTGGTLSFTVNASEAITVNTSGGVPQIALTIGTATRQASYASGSGSTALVFSYTVQAGDTDADGIAVAASITANGGTLKDAAGNDLALTLNSVGSTSAVLVDTVACLLNGSTATSRQLTNSDFSSLRSAAQNSYDITGCDVSGMTDMSQLFAEIPSFNQDISNWDVSNVTDMEEMFDNQMGFSSSSFNQDISAWNVSSVTNMANMFRAASSFNQNLDIWTVSSVINMSGMFNDATAFDGAIGSWNVSSVTNMASMFSGATAFNQDISAWDVSSVTNMYGMFRGTSSFNQTIGGWDVGAVTDMGGGMFYQSAFNQDIGSWNVSNVTTFNTMFADSSFNQDISSWDVTSVTDMNSMFESNTVFNQDISSWDVSNTTYMWYMFKNATAYNQDLSTWNVRHISSEPSQFSLGASAWLTAYKPQWGQDITAPTLSSSTPAASATGVALDANIILTFSEAVDAETGFVYLKNAGDNSTVESFNVASSSALSGSGTTTITINPTSNLAVAEAYYIEIDATAFDDAAGNSYAGISGPATLNFATITDTTAPTLTFSPADSATGVAADANITITFSEAVRLLDDTALSDTNVDALITLKDTNSGGSNIAFDATVSGNVITINPTSDFSSEQTVYVGIGATVEDSSDNAITASSATFTVAQTNSPALDFAANETAIRTVLVDDMMRAVRSSLSVSRRMISDARNRLIAFDRDEQVLASSRSPLTIDGVARADAVTASTRGTVSSSLSRNGGVYRRLFFSDFDIQHNTDTDSTTATLSARVTWEHMTSDSTMLGYFVGVEAAESDLNGTFAGDQTRLGVSAGGYVAHKLADQLYTDAYVSLGVGHSDLDMSNGTLALESDYRSETVTTGAALSGVYEYDAYEFRPEIAFNYGKTELGQVFFTGRAYGLVDDTLSLNAGSVSVANVTLRPEVIYAIQNSPTANTNASLSFSPRLICERAMSTRRTQNCGSGGEVGYTAHSNDGLRNIDFRIMVDKVGSDSRSSAVFGVEMRF
jgi:surface protein